jgi:hypothetical protein
MLDLLYLRGLVLCEKKSRSLAFTINMQKSSPIPREGIVRTKKIDILSR